MIPPHSVTAKGQRLQNEAQVCNAAQELKCEFPQSRLVKRVYQRDYSPEATTS